MMNCRLLALRETRSTFPPPSPFLSFLPHPPSLTLPLSRSLSLSLSFHCPCHSGEKSSEGCSARPLSLTLIVVRSYETSKFHVDCVRGDIFSTATAYLHSISDSDILVMLSFAIWYLYICHLVKFWLMRFHFSKVIGLACCRKRSSPLRNKCCFMLMRERVCYIDGVEWQLLMIVMINRREQIRMSLAKVTV